jgi:hypothetical protein
MKPLYRYSALAVFVILAATMASSFVAGQTSSHGDHLAVYGDVVYFFGLGKPRTCTASSQFKRGEPVGFRMTAINPATGKRDRATQMVVHLAYNGKTVDIPMRDRQTEQQPERTFWVAKWMVPEDATPGIVRYTVTAKDSEGRTGEYRPFDVDTSQITIVE